jgi:type IV secretion system protein VirB9
MGGLLVICVAKAAIADQWPIKGPGDPRIRTAAYRENEVYRLLGFVGFDIELIFEPGERFAGKGGGDLEAVTIEAHEHQVHIKPRAAIVATNLVIYTDRRAYRFDYSASAERPGRLSDELVYAVRFTYPTDVSSRDKANAPPKIDEALAQGSLRRLRNTDYWYRGHGTLRPVAASDDGVHTRLTFGERGEIPAIFVRNADDSESLLNFSMEGGDVVIHRLAPRFILRRGGLTGCIVNNGFVGAGERLESGTIAPDVERERRMPLP